MSEIIWPRALIFSMEHHIVVLYQVFSNYAPGAKNGPLRGHMFIKGETLKIFLSKTTRPRALIIGIQHHQVNFYEVCSNYIPGA